MLISANISLKVSFDKMAMFMIPFIAVLICAMLVSVNSITANAKILETEDKKLATGRIDSAQKDVNGNTSWLLSGNWKSNLFTSMIFNDTNPAKFSATVNMVLANGSSPHKHKISDFSLTRVSIQNNATTYEGTLSLSMMDGPVFGIPYLIKHFQNDTISISLEGITSDQLNVVNHFGRTPIIGKFTN
jgi:hypothetical protein